MTAGMSLEAWVGWLATPLSGATHHDIAPLAAWHGRLMVFFWGFVVPVALIVARYFKVTPGQDWPREVGNSFWFVVHRLLGHATTLATMLAVALVIVQVGWVTPFGNWHVLFGWMTTAMALLLFAGTLLRGTHGGPINPFTKEELPQERWFGDHFNMTRRRIIFEYTHKYGGTLVVLFAIAASFSGLWHADAPRWMPIALGLWWAVVGGLVVILQFQGRCLDTYQAIWGPSPDLPGSARAPIGIGVRRLRPSSDGNPT